MVFIFNNTIKNILLSNCIPHEIICDGKNPPWINKTIKVGPSASKQKKSFICFNESSLKFMENVFYLFQDI